MEKEKIFEVMELNVSTIVGIGEKVERKFNVGDSTTTEEYILSDEAMEHAKEMEMKARMYREVIEYYQKEKIVKTV